MTINVGLVGTGRMGLIHANTLFNLPGVCLKAVVSSREAAAETFAQQFGATTVSLKALLSDEQVHAVLVANSTHLHAEVAIAALRSGKAVFCEKPLSLDLGCAAQVARVAEEAQQPLFVGFNRRFDPHFQALKQAIDSGKVGSLEQLTIISRDPAPPPLRYLEHSGGLFRDMMIHDFDMARFLLNAEPVAIQVQGSALINPEIAQISDIDTATVLLTTAQGQQIQILNSRRACYGYDQRVEAFGSEGLLQLGNVRKDAVLCSNVAGTHVTLPHAFFMERYSEAFVLQMKAFIDVLKGGCPQTVTGFDGVAALYLAEQARKAWLSQKTVTFDLVQSIKDLIALCT